MTRQGLLYSNGENDYQSHIAIGKEAQVMSIVFKSLSSCLCLALAGLVIALPAHPAFAQDQALNVYSTRQSYLIEPIFDRFTKQTGVKVRTLYGKSALLERLAQEGDLSPADIFLTSDALSLLAGVDRGLAQPMTDSSIQEIVPAAFRGPDNQWVGLTMRARIIYAPRDASPADLPQTYEELSDPRFKGQICMRSGSHAYNIGLIAAYIYHYGEEAARSWVQGIKNNLARPPQGNDRAQIRGVANGECTLGLGNSYYLGVMQNNPDDKVFAEKVQPLFLTFKEAGTHVNLSGAFITAHSPRAEMAQQLLEFMLTVESQTFYASGNHEYPVNAQASTVAAGWKDLKPDSASFSDIVKNRQAALTLVQDVGINQ